MILKSSKLRILIAVALVISCISANMFVVSAQPVNTTETTVDGPSVSATGDNSYSAYLSLNEDVKATTTDVVYDFDNVVLDTKEFYVDLTKDTSPLNIYSYSYPLTIRNVKRGDVVKFGEIYKKVNRILIDEKIPSEKRKKYPVIIDKNGNIVYIPLYRSINQKVIANKLSFVVK